MGRYGRAGALVSARDALGRQWGSSWPEHIQLGHAVERMDFDNYVDDQNDQVLEKRMVPVEEVTRGLSQRHLDFSQDAEDRVTPIRQALKHSPHDLPPLVMEPTFTEGSGLRDGHHRIKVAKEFGLTHVPAYVPRGR